MNLFDIIILEFDDANDSQKNKVHETFYTYRNFNFHLYVLTNINSSFCLSHRFNSHLVLGITSQQKNSIKIIIIIYETNSSFSRFWHNF
jgi:hypothetical protein